MGDVVVMDVASRRVTRLVEVNPQLKDPRSAPRGDQLEVVRRMEIWGLLLTPPGYRPGTRVPLVYAHRRTDRRLHPRHLPQFMHRPGQIDLYPTDAMASAGTRVVPF